jgi:predicted DNA-binding transcriptional regulator YafY
MLQLLSLLQTHRQWRGPELAERLEVSERTLRRDIERLRDVGYLVDASPGVDGGYRLVPGAALPPLVLDDEEAVALAVGLQSALQAGTILGIEESSVRALTKIVQVMPPRLRHQVDAIASMTVPAVWAETGNGVDPRTLVEVAQACRDAERLHFSYADRDGYRSDRRVEPYRLVLFGRRWYVVAWDLDRQDWRSFRLDRLSEPRRTGAPFQPRALPYEDAATFLRVSIESVARQLQVEAIVDASADDVRSRLGAWASVEDLTGGRCRVRMASDALEWPTVALCTLGVSFEIVGPPEMVEFARSCAERLQNAAAPLSAENGSTG